MVSQSAEDDTLQVVFDVTDVEVDALAAADDHDDEPRVNVGASPACDTAIVLVCVGLPVVVVKVNVAERADKAVFAAAVKVVLWFPVPDFGLVVSQSAEDDTLQVVFEVTVVRRDNPPACGDHDEKARSNVGVAPACDTVIALACVGLPAVVVKVNVAERADAVGFAAAVKVTFWFPVPAFVFVVNQSAEEDTLQFVFDVTDVEVDAPLATTDHEDEPRPNVGVNAGPTVTATVALSAVSAVTEIFTCPDTEVKESFCWRYSPCAPPFEVRFGVRYLV